MNAAGARGMGERPVPLGGRGRVESARASRAQARSGATRRPARPLCGGGPVSRGRPRKAKAGERSGARAALALAARQQPLTEQHGPPTSAREREQGRRSPRREAEVYFKSGGRQKGLRPDTRAFVAPSGTARRGPGASRAGTPRHNSASTGCAACRRGTGGAPWQRAGAEGPFSARKTAREATPAPTPGGARAPAKGALSRRKAPIGDGKVASAWKATTAEEEEER